MGNVIKLVNSIMILIYRIIILLFYKVSDNKIVFQSKPDYSDNPRALSDYFEKHYPNFEIFWIVSSKRKFSNNFLKSSISFLQLYNKLHIVKWESYKTLLTSKYIVTSHNFIIPISKRLPGQRFINLWHGCGYKRNAGSKHEFERFFDIALVPGPLFLRTKSECWNTSIDYLLAKGYPRYDWLLHPSHKAKSLFENIKGFNKKVIVWMPTFRNSIAFNGYPENVISTFPLMKDQHDWQMLDNLCTIKNIKLLIKLHISQKRYNIDFHQFTSISELDTKVLDDNNVHLYELLSLSDALISDYSSVAVDYLLVDKPIAYTLDDYEIYRNTRGFVFDNPLEYMPGHHLYSSLDICNFISEVSVNQDKYKKERQLMIDKAIYKSDNYCAEISNYILHSC